ncbi:MAG: biotin/lipoyl-binding protein [Anaerolineae bacterium]|nr:biotin/lipoyl-binding protein [Chloroflexota bacterium]MBN8636605.1 biotin/lipoyl-binding protein [Anaerolineae bacterium]
MSKLTVTIGGQSFDVEFMLTESASELAVKVNGETIQVVRPDANQPFEACSWMIIDGRPLEIEFDRDLHWIRSKGDIEPLEIVDCEAVVARPRSGDGRIKAPIPGLITTVLVVPGEAVEAGQPLLYLEAMKMQNEIRAPFAGKVKAIHVGAAQTVTRDQVLAEVE